MKSDSSINNPFALLGLCAVGLAAACDAQPRTRVEDLGQGRFQLALDPAVGTTPPAWLGGVVQWEYAGQATYVRPGDRQVAKAAAKGDGPATDTVSRLLSSTMEDEYGRLFRPKSVDVERLRAAIVAYNDQVARDVGLEAEGLTRDTGDATDPARGEGSYTPLSWSRLDQNGDGEQDLFLWNSDDRILVTDPLTDPQEKAVVYFLGDVGRDERSCTGTIVGDYWVVTAAHCAKDESGLNWAYAEDSDPSDHVVESSKGKVCTRGNFHAGANCADVVARWGNGEYTGNGDMGDDIVMMKLDEPLGRANYMALSQASDSTLKAAMARNLGHPGLTPTGGSNLLNCSFSTDDSFAGFESDRYAPCQMRMFRSSADCNHASAKVLGTQVDMSAGHSGGPIYYFPNGVGGAHYLTAVVSGNHNGWTENYNGGAKVPYHRDWMIGIMNDN